MTTNNVWPIRKRQLQAYMEEQGIDVAIITSPTHVYYFTGFHCDPHERFLALAIDVRSGAETLFVPLLDRLAAQQQADVSRIVAVSDTDNPYDTLRANTVQPSSIGLEKNFVSLAAAERLTAIFPDARLHDLEPAILSLRMKKTEEEIAKVSASIALIEQVMAHAVKHAAIGMTELDLTAELEYQMKRLGADKPAFESIVLTGARTALPHGHPGPTPIRPGDLVLIDIGVKAQGYCSDITRTFIMGEGTREQERIYETVLAANEAAIRAVRTGAPISVLDDTARQIIASRGYGEYFPHRVGHGFGMDIHEAPSIHGENGMLMEPGLLFTIEPGVYVPQIGGVRIEDDIYIASDGSARVLTSFPKRLTRIG